MKYVCLFMQKDRKIFGVVLLFVWILSSLFPLSFYWPTARYWNGLPV